MRGKQSICLFCRHTTQTRNRFNPPRRLASVPSAEPYVLPRLIIDLDAADSTFVRRVDEAPVPKETRVGEIQIRRVQTLKENGKRVTLRNARPKVPLQTLKVTPIDLWAYALLGITEFTPHQDSQGLRNIVSKRAIHSVDSADSVVQELLSAFSIDPSTNLRRAGFCRENEKAILDQILKVRTFSRLRRMISLLSSTQDGCEFLVRNGTYILDAIRANRKKQERTQFAERIPSSTVLDLFNNLHINLESKGLVLGPQLCNGALYYASRACNIAAVKMYLQLARKHKYAPDWRSRKALRAICVGLVTDDRGLKREGRKTEALELITGWRGGTAPRKGEVRSTCFAYLSYMDTSKDIIHAIYPAYILGLGELGLQGAIYAEFTARDSKRMNPILLGDEHLRFRAQMFAIAFLLAKDEEHALQVLESVPREHEDITISTDMEMMQTWRANNSPMTVQGYSPTPKSSNLWLLSLLFDHYSFHNCLPTPPLQDHLAETIVRLPREPHLAVETLKTLLLLDLDLTRRPMGSARRVFRLITWGEKDGKECIRLDSKRKRGPAEEDLGDPTF